MTKFEDNLSPYLTVVEQASTPANPSSGDQKLFVRTSDHVLCYVNSSGTVTPVSSGGGAGTGNAGAVYAMGNGAAIWNAGTSFPGSKATNDRYFRTDLGLEFYWDGTRWLSTTLYELPLVWGVNESGQTNKTSAIANDLAAYLVDAFVTWYVATTNDGSKYWTFQFFSTAGSNTDTNRGSAISTAAGSASVYTSSTVAIGVALTTASIKVGVSNIPTGAVGNVYWGPMIRYRKIAT